MDHDMARVNGLLFGQLDHFYLRQVDTEVIDMVWTPHVLGTNSCLTVRAKQHGAQKPSSTLLGTRAVFYSHALLTICVDLIPILTSVPFNPTMSSVWDQMKIWVALI